MNVFRNAAFAFAASGLVLTAAPAAAFDAQGNAGAAPVVETWQQYRDYDRYDRYDRDDRRYDRRGDRYGRHDRRYDDRRYDDRRYEEPVYRDTRVWRGRDGATYCRKKDGTTGLIVGGAAGAILGREIDSRGDRSLGTILGAAAGALLGKQVAQGTRCR